MKTYAITDIETVPDRKLWNPEVEIEKIRLKDGKAPTKGELEFLTVVSNRVQEGTPIHRDDLEKALDITTRKDDASSKKDDASPTKDTDGVKKENDGVPSDLTLKISHLVEQLPKEKTQIAPTFAQCPIVIGILWIGEDLSIKKLGAISASQHPTKDGMGYDEKKLLTAWSDFVNDKSPVIVDWNGRGFDLPALALRSFRHGVPMGWYYSKGRDYRYRYSDDPHLDLFDYLSDFGSVNKTGFKLDNFARAIGLPGKYGVDGSMVEGMYLAGKIDEIEKYCLSDVIQTAFVLYRHFYIRTKINLETYQRGVTTLLEHIAKDGRFGDFLKLVDDKTLLLPSEEAAAAAKTEPTS